MQSLQKSRSRLTILLITLTLAAPGEAEAEPAAVSTGEVRIRVSIASSGGLSPLDAESKPTPLSPGMPWCLWLNTANRAYTLRLESRLPSYALAWNAGHGGISLGTIPSVSFLAAPYPNCSSGGEATLTARRTGRRGDAGEATLLVAPE